MFVSVFVLCFGFSAMLATAIAYKIKSILAWRRIDKMIDEYNAMVNVMARRERKERTWRV